MSYLLRFLLYIGWQGLLCIDLFTAEVASQPGEARLDGIVTLGHDDRLACFYCYAFDNAAEEPLFPEAFLGGSEDEQVIVFGLENDLFDGVISFSHLNVEVGVIITVGDTL